MKTIATILLLVLMASGCHNHVDEPVEYEYAGWPPGTVMAAEESNATHRLIFTFSIDGHLGEKSYEYFFRVLRQPGDMETGLPSYAAYADGGGGGYSLRIHPSPSSLFKSNRVSFAITFNESHDGKKTIIEESVDVTLFESSTGKNGLVQYRTEWKAEQEN